MYSVGMKKSKNMLKKFKICVDKKRQTWYYKKVPSRKNKK
jgi:hypothetical protein